MVPSDHIMTFAEYAKLRHAVPYVVDVTRGASRLVLFGVYHSSDPAEPMFDQIEVAFSNLKPAFALHEGTPPAIENEREIAIRRHCETGLVRYLANRTAIATASMDIPLKEEARLLRCELGSAEALVFLVVRQLASYNRKTARPPFHEYFEDFFSLIAPGLELSRIDWPTIEREHASLLGRRLSAERVTGVETDPMRDDLPTQRIARLSNRLRDEHMLDRLMRALAEHERVFATVGVTHAVMLEPALVVALQAR